MRGHWFALQVNQWFFTKRKQKKNWVSGGLCSYTPELDRFWLYFLQNSKWGAIVDLKEKREEDLRSVPVTSRYFISLRVFLHFNVQQPINFIVSEVLCVLDTLLKRTVCLHDISKYVYVLIFRFRVRTFAVSKPPTILCLLIFFVCLFALHEGKSYVFFRGNLGSYTVPFTQNEISGVVATLQGALF